MLSNLSATVSSLPSLPFSWLHSWHCLFLTPLFIFGQPFYIYQIYPTCHHFIDACQLFCHFSFCSSCFFVLLIFGLFWCFLFSWDRSVNWLCFILFIVNMKYFVPSQWSACFFWAVIFICCIFIFTGLSLCMLLESNLGLCECFSTSKLYSGLLCISQASLDCLFDPCTI